MNDRLRDMERLGLTRNDDVDQMAAFDELETKNVTETKGGYKNGKMVPEDSMFVNSFYEEVANAKRGIDSLTDKIETLEKLYNKMEGGVKNEKSAKELKEKADTLDAEITKTLASTKKALKNMEEENRKVKKEKGQNGELRIRENQFAALTERFQEIMGSYKDVQERRKETQTENMVRLAVVVMGDDADEEEIRDKVKKGELSVETVFQQRLNATDGHTIKATYNEVKETRDELLKIEQSMNELYEMFQDMHELVRMQADLLDNIEVNVNKSIAYVETGISNLKTARKVGKIKRRKCIIA